MVGPPPPLQIIIVIIIISIGIGIIIIIISIVAWLPRSFQVQKYTKSLPSSKCR